MEGLAERPEVRSGAAGSRQQRGSAAGPPRGVVFVPDSIPAPFLAEILAQELAGLGIEEANVQAIPLQVLTKRPVPPGLAPEEAAATSPHPSRWTVRWPYG